MENLNNRQKVAEMKARIIDEWIALNAMAYVDIPNELEDHLYEIANEEVTGEISFHLENKEYICALLNSDALINLSCFDFISEIKIDGLFEFQNKESYCCNIIFSIKL